jgi:heterodisulfide reductase subunit B2
MKSTPVQAFSYFPGCSLASTAKENNASLIDFFETIGVVLKELPDWNCCGSSSIHCIDADQAVLLAARNLALAPAGRPLMVACPNCLLRLKTAQLKIGADSARKAQYETILGRPFDPELEILHVFDVLARIEQNELSDHMTQRLDGLRFAAYYGCMLSRPPALRHEKQHHGLMENILAQTGAKALPWGRASRCCGTFLSVVHPDLVTTMVNDIVMDAVDAGADCIVTACAMCHLNLEVRCTLSSAVPILHFSELLSLAAGNASLDKWFARHLIDPGPLFKRMKLG